MSHNKLQDQYYGNYRGKVLEHGTNGLCKIFVPGVYPEEYEYNIVNLPWAEPCQPLFAGGSLGNGVFQYPDINSTVWLFFEAGNINKPIFFGLTNNDKNKFISGEFIIHYDKSVIKFDNANNITITAEPFYPPSSSDNTDTTTGVGGGKGTITLNAETIKLNSNILDINNVATTIDNATTIINSSISTSTVAPINTMTGIVSNTIISPTNLLSAELLNTITSPIANVITSVGTNTIYSDILNNITSPIANTLTTAGINNITSTGINNLTAITNNILGTNNNMHADVLNTIDGVATTIDATAAVNIDGHPVKINGETQVGD